MTFKRTAGAVIPLDKEGDGERETVRKRAVWLRDDGSREGLQGEKPKESPYNRDMLSPDP